MKIVRELLSSADARALIAALNAELAAMYPEPGANHFGLSEDDVAPGRGAFVILRDDGGVPLACGALRRLDEERAEVKRMFVLPAARGRGLGRMVLDALEAEARSLGVERMVLETGVRQVEALRLYERAGFVPTPPWGEYMASAATSVCLERRL